MGVLDGKTVLVTGILTADSLGFAAAEAAQTEGATVIATGFGRSLSLTRRVLRKLPEQPALVELDATDDASIDAAVAAVAELSPTLDGLVHSIGWAPEACIGQGMLVASAADVAEAMQVSTYSLASLCRAFRPLLKEAGGSSVVGLDFDGERTWPGYDWMGVAKAALEGLARYLAVELGGDGIRVNLVAAGPVSTVAARSLPTFTDTRSAWGAVAPLGWDVSDPRPVGRAVVALLSDLLGATTGEILHADGGVHVVGAVRPVTP